MLRSVVNLIHYPKLHITTLDCCSGQFSGHYDSRVLTYKRRSNTRLATALVHCFTFVVGVCVCQLPNCCFVGRHRVVAGGQSDRQSDDDRQRIPLRTSPHHAIRPGKGSVTCMRFTQWAVAFG